MELLLLITGYAGALLIGVSLGLLGGGGSILTVPVLVYLLQVEPVLATAYSLFVVGVASFVGALRYMLRHEVALHLALTFAIPSFIAVYIIRAWLLPRIPAVLWTAGDWTLTKDAFIMGFFGLIMLAAAFSMIRQWSLPGVPESGIARQIWVIIEGFIVGAITGLVGAGGGFLIIPALVVVMGLPMKTAVGTGLVIITLKSLIGFTGDIAAGQPIEWGFLAGFTGLAIAGIFAGTYVSKYISGARLKPAFGWFVLAMGSYIAVRELWLFSE